MRRSSLRLVSDSLRGLAACTAALGLLVSGTVADNLYHDHRDRLDALSAPLTPALDAIDHLTGADWGTTPTKSISLPQALKAARHDDPGARIVAGEPAVLAEQPKGTVAISVRGSDPQRFLVAYRSADGRLQTERIVPTVDYPDGVWVDHLSHPHWRSAMDWFWLLLGVGEGPAALLALLSLLAGVLATRRPSAKGVTAAERKRWRERVPGSDLGPQEPQLGHTVYVPANETDVDEDAGLVTIRFVAKPFRWTQKFDDDFDERGCYWNEGKVVKEDELDGRVAALPREWPGDADAQELSAAWFEFCHAVGDWNKARWAQEQERETQRVAAERERQERISAQLQTVELLAAPEPDTLLPGSLGTSGSR